MAKEKKIREPYKYDPKFHDAWAFSLAIRGATDEEMAKAFGVSRMTIDRWSKAADDRGEEILSSFGEARRAGKEQADAQVVKKLFDRCIGYESKEVQQIADHDKATGKLAVRESRTTSKHVPPDVMAIMYWLNNRSRKSGEWSQKQDISLNFSGGEEDVVIYLPAKEGDADG